MENYAQLYLSELKKEASILGTVGNFAKAIVVDPAVGLVKDIGGTAKSIWDGDYAGAASHALSGLGNAAITAGNAAFLLPGVGTAAGTLLRGAGLGIRGARAAGAASKIIGAAGKASKPAANVAGRAVSGAGNAGKIGFREAIGGAMSRASGRAGFGLGRVIGGAARAAGQGARFERASRGVSGFGRAMARGSSAYQTRAEKLVRGMPGFNVLWGPKHGGFFKQIGVPFLAHTGLYVGSDLLANYSHQGRFNRLISDPNFQKWIGYRNAERIYDQSERVGASQTYRIMRDQGLLDAYNENQREIQEFRDRQLRRQQALRGY